MKETVVLDSELRERLEKIFEKTEGIEEVILFGSRALGNAHCASDVDLALKGPLSFRQMLSLLDRLNEQLSVPLVFDLIDYSGIENQALKEHIDLHGRTLFKRKGALRNTAA